MPVVCTQPFAKITSISVLIFLSVSILFAMGLGASPVTAAPSELFFSEYIEGSSSNKALEIFNGTGATVDLSVYSVELYSNGSSTASQSVNLSGNLTDGDVFVLAHGSAVVAITNVADLINNAVVNFNGDDTIVLRRSGLIIDVIGQIGVDPGSKWGDAPTSTKDNTLRRKFFIETGDADGSDSFEPSVEWDGFATDTFDGLGVHTTTPPPPPPPLAVVINEVAWAGTVASSADEWIELLNTTTQTITLTGWAITSTNGLDIPLDGTTIDPGGYYVIERSDDNAIIDVEADLARSFGSGLANGGDTLFLSTGGVVIDTANADGGPWPAGISSAAGNYTMERNNPYALETDAAWASNKGCRINGLDADGNPIFGTPGQPNAATLPPLPAPPVLISEFVYDGLTPSTEGDEFIELCNPTSTTVDLSCYKVGDEEMSGGGEGMYRLPISTTLTTNACLVVANNADQFQARFNSLPDFEVIVTGSSSNDNPAVPNLSKYTVWGTGNWSLSNTGDELLLLGPNDEILDSVAYRNGDYTTLGLEPDASAPEPRSLQRVWPTDTDSMPHDFVRTTPNPGQLTELPPAPADLPPPASLPNGMNAYWGHLHAHTTYSDGAGPPFYALAAARAAGLHFYSITDHGWWLTQDEWTSTLSQTIKATIPGQFIALRGVEWSHDTAGHINVFNTNTLVSRTDPTFDDLSDFYTWLAANPSVIAQFNHPDPSYGGTFSDFSLNLAAAQMMYLQEIGNSAQDYTTYEPSFVKSNAVGWRTAPTNNSDTHGATWGEDTPTRTGIVAPALTEADLLDAMRARRVFATEDSNLALTLRANGAWMGSVLTTTGKIPLTVDFVDPDPEPLTLFVYERNLLLDSESFPASTGQWAKTVRVRPGHYYWAKVVQADGDTAYSAPIWIEGQAPADKISINELLPAPNDWDWDGNGTADYTDEWIELYNSLNRPVGLGGWRLIDASGSFYDIPLGVNIRANGFATFYYTQTNIALNNDGDTVSLIHPNGTVIDSVDYDHSPGYDDTWCRLPDAGNNWSDYCGPSPDAANWEKKPNGPLDVNIFEAKRLTRNAWVTIKGQVTAPPGLLGARTMYIQDETSGILVYLPKDHGLFFNLGDEVEVVGNLSTFHEEFEIVVSKRSDVSYQKAGAPLPPLPIVTTSMLEPYEGMLVLLQGQVAGFKGRSTFWVDDGTDPAKVYIRQNTKIKKPFIEPGTPITVVGIVSQYSDKNNPSRVDYRLLLRYQTDLILPDTSLVPADWPSMLPETGF